jgi:hypothetical protein
MEGEAKGDGDEGRSYYCLRLKSTWKKISRTRIRR